MTQIVKSLLVAPGTDKPWFPARAVVSEMLRRDKAWSDKRVNGDFQTWGIEVLHQFLIGG